jgi:DNA-3-methyladenine glycosylase
MPFSSIIPKSFYERPTLKVARDLLGKRLVHNPQGVRITGTIVETEAYRGEEDQACHARAGRTPRTSIMYGHAGMAYIYFTYGMHWLLNCVTEREGFPAAVLLRAIIPLEGQEQMAARRVNISREQWCNGPAKLCQAMGIDGRLNGADLCSAQRMLWIEEGASIPDCQVTVTPRIGINRVPEPWRNLPWRFLARL